MSRIMVINKKYQVTIPKEVIEKIKLKAVDIVEIEAVDDLTIRADDHKTKRRFSDIEEGGGKRYLRTL